jgi:hypothetical protein
MDQVVPRPEHATKPEHWLLVDGWLLTRWLAARWDHTAGLWWLGRRPITPEQAARKRWRYSGPMQSPADIMREPPRDAWQVHG